MVAKPILIAAALPARLLLSAYLESATFVVAAVTPITAIAQGPTVHRRLLVPQVPTKDREPVWVAA